ENLEVTRLYRDLKARFENVDANAISKEDKKAYNDYLLYKAAFEEKLGEINEQYAQYAQLAALYQGAYAYMKEKLGADELTINELLKFNPESEDDSQVRDFLLMAEREGLKQYIVEGDEYFESSIKYHLNLDF